jgi:hypothetical protein
MGHLLLAHWQQVCSIFSPTSSTVVDMKVSGRTTRGAERASLHGAMATDSKVNSKTIEDVVRISLLRLNYGICSMPKLWTLILLAGKGLVLV